MHLHRVDSIRIPATSRAMTILRTSFRAAYIADAIIIIIICAILVVLRTFLCAQSGLRSTYTAGPAFEDENHACLITLWAWVSSIGRCPRRGKGARATKWKCAPQCPLRFSHPAYSRCVYTQHPISITRDLSLRTTPAFHRGNPWVHPAAYQGMPGLYALASPSRPFCVSVRRGIIRVTMIEIVFLEKRDVTLRGLWTLWGKCSVRTSLTVSRTCSAS